MAGLEAGQPGSASFFLSLTIFWGLLLVIFSFVLDLLLVIFSTPLWVVIKVDPEYAQGTGMKYQTIQRGVKITHREE